MNKVKQIHISMGRGEITSLSDAETQQVLRLVCRQGSAWVTLANDQHDYVIEAGTELEIKSAADKIIVESLSAHLELDVDLCA